MLLVSSHLRLVLGMKKGCQQIFFYIALNSINTNTDFGVFTSFDSFLKSFLGTLGQEEGVKMLLCLTGLRPPGSSHIHANV